MKSLMFTGTGVTELYNNVSNCLAVEINMVVVGTLPDELFHNELHYLLKLVGICLHDVRTFVLGLDVVPWSQ